VEKGWKEKIKHASSRKLILKNGYVIKFYPKIYGYLVHELARVLFFLLYKVYSFPFISPEKRILNEIRGRKILKTLNIKTTKIEKADLKRKYIKEKFEKETFTLDDLEAFNPSKAAKFAKIIGKITRKVNEERFYFIDNRASNWLVGKNLIRTDLELIKVTKKHNSFLTFCDILSFVSSVKSEKLKDEFMKGYGKRIKFSLLLTFLVKSYIQITDLIF
jgi:hypothetical protein